MPLPSPTLATQQTQRPSSAWTAWGQWLALITMTVDHVTRYLLPGSWDAGWASSSIGRIAFPLFAGMVAWHGLFNTRDPLRYARRILIIGLVAQLPYMTMPRDGFQLNITFTLALGLIWGTWLRDLSRRSGVDADAPLQTPLLIGGSLVLWWLLGSWVEYGHLGLLLVPLYMFALQALSQPSHALAERLMAAGAALPVLLVAGLMNSSDMAKSFTVATTLFVLLMAAGAASRIPRITPGARMPRKLWLAWYPAHFAVIAILLHWPR
ncbi:TraX protein [Modicisalibacter ilicicola DSM 19980]|uniref:TraX protein n=1 Tax=Modicisalibacter ilicicola DSM 19980 TaxID=1121942 RepID=A0A1M4TFY2_9GAMM|nr:TraX family protein [Halomonas ilicicola]SHE43373.1 TraX protein [Halomonas ilicicola DSM 19980]